ncbi:ATP-grasp fold amidoligase family protein [Paenibacillus protaetiae]|uniref:Glycosyl transferase n=1 Tax=Paenibacillus protaetiae TaxID=2509456 RepID=A0A4P6EY74_9BACL|nr:ATP-grasp fold amidoligase family protein [Paenibacillus protaetiae]QAY67786.1 glycosyl transferase [Paenibacillus protaetiae]
MKYLFLRNITGQLLNFLPNETLLKYKYKYHIGEKLNLNNPQTFNEKLQWLKLNDRRTEYVNYVDKFTVRQHVSKMIGDNYLIPLLGVYNSTDEIKWSELPDQFVLKCTHGSGCNIICQDKKKLNKDLAVKMIQKWMSKNWYWYGREWPYKHVKPRIICEKYMVDESGYELKDYKVFCFGGVPKIVQVDFNRFTNHKRNFYDTDWNYIDVSIKFSSDPTAKIGRPENLEKMLSLASNLASNFPHVRVDFYNVNGKIYFGELTFYHGSGFEKIKPKEFDYQLGKWIKLPDLNK